MSESTFVLITAARNEEACIAEAIESVRNQSVLPLRWVIVSDGSTDRTDDIVQGYVHCLPFLQLLQVKSEAGRGVASKVNAVNAGYAAVRHLDFHYLGNLDADVRMESDYFSRLMHELGRNPRLGIVGGLLRQDGGDDDLVRFANPASVCGAVQMFRRRCFEEVGGYRSVRLFGEDTVAEFSARQKGWETYTIPDARACHTRSLGINRPGRCRMRIQQGINDYHMGYHPLFFLFKTAYRVVEKPYLLGSLLRLFGYVYAGGRREERSVSDELAEFVRAEQMGQLRTFLKSFTGVAWKQQSGFRFPFP